MQRIVELFKIDTLETAKGMLMSALLCLIVVIALQKYLNTHVITHIVNNVVSVIIVVLLMFSVSRIVLSIDYIKNVIYMPNSQIETVAIEPTTQMQTQEMRVVKFVSTQTEYVVTNGGTVVCDLYSIEDAEITLQDIQIPKEITADVQISKDEKHYIIMFQNVRGAAGAYTIRLRDTEWQILINITDELISSEVQMQCVPSKTQLKAGETMTLTVIYTGVGITNKTSTNYLSIEYLNLINCVGNCVVEKISTDTYCIAIKDFGVLDSTKEVSVNILNGSVVDSTGIGCNGASIDITYIE
jgi:hypothetical protein